MAWIGKKKIAFVPLSRPNAHPPDAIPSDWENDILRRVLYDPDPATGKDKSLRAFIHTVSSGVADLDAIVTERHSIDLQDVPPSILEGEIGARLRAEGCDAAAIVMLGGPGAGMNSGFWSRFVMREPVGTWAMELMHGLTGFTDIYSFDNDADPQDPVMGLYDEMSAAGATHPSAYTKAGIQWIDRDTIAEHVGRVGTYALHAISLTQPPPTGRVAAVKIGAGVPYLMVEARLMADQFDARIPREGVIVYQVQTPDLLGHRINNLRPLILKAPEALAVGQTFVSDNAISITIPGTIPGGFLVAVEDRNAWNGSGRLSTVSGVVSVTGHFATADQRHIVLVGTTRGSVHEIFWKPSQSGIEGEDDLPVAFGAGSIVSVTSIYNSDDQRHVAVVGTSAGRVHEIFWKSDTVGVEGHDDLPVSFTPGSIVAVSGLYARDQRRHLVVVGTTAGKVHEIFWKSDTVGVEGHDDLPVSFTPGSIVGLAAFYNNDERRHVVVVGTTAGKVHEIFWKADTVGIEGEADLPLDFGSGGIAAIGGFYDSNRQRYVVVVGSQDGKVHEIHWKASTVGIEAHTIITEFPAGSIVSVAGFYSESDQVEHVVVGLSNGSIEELWLTPNA